MFCDDVNCEKYVAVDHLVTVCVCACVRACMRLYTGVASATALQEVNEGIDSENENKLEKNTLYRDEVGTTTLTKRVDLTCT